MSVVRRLDHVIWETADIRTEHSRLLALGYPEAWPIGPFWPSALTSGIAVGPFNVELYQPLDQKPSTPAIQTLVFQPTSIEDAEAAVQGEVREKIEPNPELLRLRGFEETARPQRICTNLLPSDPPFPFFFCAYAPFLHRRLAPEAFDVPKERQVRRLVYGLASYDEAMPLIEKIGSDPLIHWVPAEVDGVIEVNPAL